MTRTKTSEQLALDFPDKDLVVNLVAETEAGVTIPLELDAAYSLQEPKLGDLPELPARWEAARSAAERKHVLPVLLSQLRRITALDHLEYLIGLARDEGYAWVVYGETGSGKSAFFHTLEHQTNSRIRTHIISGNSIKLADQQEFSRYLEGIISSHKLRHGEDTPLIVVLEDRETSMSTEERSSIAQALKNILRPPGPGSNVIFVLPVTSSNQGSLFFDQARDTGVPVPMQGLHKFEGPRHTEYVDILTSLFITLNDKDIAEYGLQRSDLQAHVSDQQTIGQFIRTIRELLEQQRHRAGGVFRRHSYRPISVVVGYINPLPGYRTEPIIKAMTLNSVGRIRSGEILGATQGQRAQKWESKRQALRNIVEALDLRIVEIPPPIVAKILYAYGWQKPSARDFPEATVLQQVETYLDQEGVDYNSPKNIRQNLRQQLAASNLIRLIASQGTQSYPTPRYGRQDSEVVSGRIEKERAEVEITRKACEVSQDKQHELHKMFALALGDLFQNTSLGPGVSDFKAVYPEAWLTVKDEKGVPQKRLRTDVVIEFQDRLVLLELCWRSADHFTYSDIASYVLRKIEESYTNLPLVRDLAADSTT